MGADKNYDVAEFVQAMRDKGVTPHVAQKKVGSAIDGRTTRHAGYAVSIKKRKLVEEILAGRRPSAVCARPDLSAWPK